MTWLSIELGVRKLIAEYPVLGHCLLSVAEWTKKCREEHPNCCSVQRLPEQFPARLIDVGLNDGDSAKLIQTIQSNFRFVTLS